MRREEEEGIEGDREEKQIRREWKEEEGERTGRERIEEDEEGRTVE